MKTARLVTLIIVVVTFLSSCDPTWDPKDGGFVPPPIDFLNLSITVNDLEGNDLVAPLGKEYYNSGQNNNNFWKEIKPNDFSLYIQLADVQGANTNRNYLEVGNYDKRFSFCDYTDSELAKEGEGNWFLLNSYAVITGEPSRYNPVTYRIKCPKVFGDDSEHIIEASWKEDIQRRTQGERYYECEKASFDGKEISVKKVKFVNDINYTIYLFSLDIILDK